MPSLQNTPLLRQLLPALAQRDLAVSQVLAEAVAAGQDLALLALDKATRDASSALADTCAHLAADSSLLRQLLAEVQFWQRAALTAGRLTHDATTVGLSPNESVLAGILYGMTLACTPDHTASLSIADLYDASH